ncbi:MAG: GNAT family N-acetyltransferase [Firmicutes bacterium]|nr:GNAT family N-acetyltransferase [Bacillota bacterium]
MKGTIRIKTERFILREHKIEDAEHLYNHLGTDERMIEFSGWNPYATPESARETVQDFIDRSDDENFYGWAVEHNSEIIGTVGAYDYDPEESSAEVGISIFRTHWGKGCASEVLRTVLCYLTEQRNVKIVRAWCAKDNIGSRKTMEKCGMKMVSIEKDALSINGHIFDKLNYEYRGI